MKDGAGDLDFGEGANTDGSEEEAAEASRPQPTESRVTSGEDMGTAYPYFVRRNNVGDERDTRLEIHVRDGVASQESEFRNELADLLDTDIVSKTDAREFALLAAFEHPEHVAELMRNEGYQAGSS